MISEPRADKQKQDEGRQPEPTGRKEEMMSRFPQPGAPLSAILLLATAPVHYRLSIVPYRYRWRCGYHASPHSDRKAT